MNAGAPAIGHSVDGPRSLKAAQNLTCQQAEETNQPVEGGPVTPVTDLP